MPAKPAIAIVGPGNLGTSLALSLSRASFRVTALVLRRHSKSRRRAQQLAKQIGSRVAEEAAQVDADLLWFCVPDSEIAQAARLFTNSSSAKQRFAFHSSGALTSDELRLLRRKGFAIASVHPLMTFVPGSRPALEGVPFAVEGDAAATRLARRIVEALGGSFYRIREQDKAAYHAWGTFASPLFTSLLATTEQVAAAAGIKRGEARRRMTPILLQTLANYARYGAPGAFSGPIVRGDIDTVKKHLRILRPLPVARGAYLALARAALQYLPAKNKKSLESVLRSREFVRRTSAHLRKSL
jgi:predicted short-subunit dehydrogenase-like oxidoreductase (DUF2520 family)